MRGLAARLAGGKGVADPSARWADRGQIFPWRPKRADGTGKVKAVMGALLAACVVFSAFSPSGGPLIFSELKWREGWMEREKGVPWPSELSAPPSGSPASRDRAGRDGGVPGHRALPLALSFRSHNPLFHHFSLSPFFSFSSRRRVRHRQRGQAERHLPSRHAR